MKIKLAETSGFCFGVKNAVEKTYEILDSRYECDTTKKYMFGKLIHNSTVIDEMIAKGIKIAQSVDEINDKSTVVLRAHGVSPEIKEQLEQKACNIVDCTCPFVTKIHTIVRKACCEKKQIILIGDPEHPEIAGINGECDYNALIFSEPEQVEMHDFIDKPSVIAAQTTYSYMKYKKICKFLKKKIANLEIFDTICITTEKRQKEAKELSAVSDMMIVIGSNTSSNTVKLFELCKLNCRKTYLVEKLSDVDFILENEEISSYSIGVVAGASTPERIIGEVINKMSEKGGIESQQEKDNLYFSEYVESISQLHRGATVKGAIIRHDNEYVYVDVRDKSEGRIPVHEFNVDTDFDLDKAVANHEEVDVYVRSIRNTDQGKEILLSKARVDFTKYKDIVEKAFLDKEPTMVKITKSVKDGIIGTIGGIDIYIHRTQIEMGVVDDLDSYIGKEMEILVTQFDPDKRRLRVSGSKRILLNQERREKAESLWSEIEIDKVYKGIVRSLTDFGAFVDIGGVDGLIHVSELSWERIKHPSDVVKPGEEVEVFIKDFDQEKRRISLGYKKSSDDPYKNVEETYPVGAIITGKVVRMFPFGAFIELEPGVDALCHISQISNVRLIKPSDSLSEGMEVAAKILEVDGTARRISISIKDVEAIDPVNEPSDYQEYKDTDENTKSSDTTEEINPAEEISSVEAVEENETTEAVEENVVTEEAVEVNETTEAVEENEISEEIEATESVESVNENVKSEESEEEKV